MIKKNRMLKELSFQQLKTQQKKFTTFVSILSILTMLTLAAMIYFFLKNGNHTFLVLCGGFSFALLLCALILKQIESEITARELE
ncbi:hypothetical protein [Epilithonimonas vandammei]|uniref:hypothetical protein n=1 Tax=Epilithonimonas vandammei TaxID=2487072 RepID=UPI0028AD0E68|nr:hypothetical protein [Epilithonimonas vandammei]